MKTSILRIFILFFVLSNVAMAHKQSVHQYITREAFKLLCRAYPQLANSEMASHIGTNETSSSTEKSWGAGKIVSGAWIEDEYDIVYHYGMWNVPNFNQWSADAYYALFPGGQREAFTSITHFWNADGGPNSVVNLHDYADGIYWSFSCENAMQKMYKYLNGDFDNRWLYNISRNWECSPSVYEGSDMRMSNLFDLYRRTKTIYAVQYYGEDMHWYPANGCPEMNYGLSWIYEQLGRMCHLLQDQSVPAHVHCDSHACSHGMYCDYYENNADYFHLWTADEIFMSGGAYIDPYNTWGDPLYYLMYLMNEATDHYADGLTNGDDNYDANCPGLSQIISSEGVPTLTSQINYTNCSAMHDKLFPLVIRATAGLLYWFAKETNQIPQLEPFTVNITGTFEFDPSGSVASQNSPGACIVVAAPSPYTKNGRQYVFNGWSDGVTDNARIVCTATTLTANYKAHLLTSLSTATGIGNQRKIIREYDGGPLDMVYSSSNKIWFTTSSDNGSTWSSEQQISGSGTASSPSIATDVWGDDVYIVWQEVVGNTKYLYIKSLYGYVPTPQVLDSDVSSFDLQQSLAVSDDVTVLVVYRKSNGLGGPWKLYYTYSNDGSNFSAGQQVFVSTPVDFDYPSIAWNPQIDSFMVSASSRSYSYTVPLFTFSGTTWEWPCNVYPSTSSFPPTTPYSQIAVDGYGRTHVTWIAYDDYYTGGEFPSSAAMERNYYNGSLSAISIFRVQDVPIIYTSVSGHNDANGGASLFFCGNPTDYLRDIYSTDGSSWNGTINISPSGNRINYPISLEKAPPSSVTYTVVKGSSSPYNVISQTKDNSQPGYGYGTLKTASDASAQTATLYRRIELIDTTTGGLLAVQFGNISGNSSPFQNINPGGSHGKGISDFMKTSPFTLQQNASMEAEFGVRSKDWKRNANISLELVDTVSGKTVQQIGSYNFAASDTGSFFQEKTNQVVNKLQNINGILRVKIDSVNYENLVVNYMNVFFFGGSGSIKKQEKNIVQIGEIPAEFQVSQNYPNPFNPTTQINYQLPANCRVTLKVYDVLGREIATLVDEEKPSGFYSVQWDAHNVSSGIYFYRIIVSNSNGQSSFTEAKRMVVMK